MSDINKLITNNAYEIIKYSIPFWTIIKKPSEKNSMKVHTVLIVRLILLISLLVQVWADEFDRKIVLFLIGGTLSEFYILNHHRDIIHTKYLLYLIIIIFFLLQNLICVKVVIYIIILISLVELYYIYKHKHKNIKYKI